MPPGARFAAYRRHRGAPIRSGLVPRAEQLSGTATPERLPAVHAV